MPFYDTDEDKIMLTVNLDASIDSNYKLFYLIRKQSTVTNTALYGNEIFFNKKNFTLALPINDTLLKSGNYTIVLSLLDTMNALVQAAETSFQTLRAPNTFFQKEKNKNQSLYSSKIAASANDIDIRKTFVAKYDLKKIRTNVRALSPMAEKAEQGALKGIIESEDVEQLQRFFYNFWYTRNPQNPEAEWKLYADKLNYCAKNFAYGTFKGYQTDMGRLYLRFGAPNRRLRATNERGTKPYEVWFYNELDQFTNLNLLFAQIGTLGNERVLIHSNVPGFYFNPNWASQLFVDAQEQNNKNSHRVYEFFK